MGNEPGDGPGRTAKLLAEAASPGRILAAVVAGAVGAGGLASQIPEVSGPAQLLLIAGIIVVLIVTVGFVGWALIGEVRHRAVVSDSPEERRSLERLQRVRTAVRGVFGDAVSNDVTTYLVYSSQQVTEIHRFDGVSIKREWADRESRVTTVLDTEGIGRVHALLGLGEKQENLEIVAAQDFDPRYWDSNLILIGSDNANPATGRVLSSPGAPFRFIDLDGDGTVDAIVDARSGGRQWPMSEEDERLRDYGLIVKVEKKRLAGRRTYFVLAGIGAIGTLAACQYLCQKIDFLHGEFEGLPFGCVVGTDKDDYYKVELVAREPA